MQQAKTLLAVSLLSLTTFTAQAVLTSNGNGGVYSSLGNVTWTVDANLLGTMEANPASSATIIADIIAANGGVIHDTPNFYDGYTGTYHLTAADFGANGLTNWFGAQAFVGYLSSVNYGNSSQWALPSAGSNPQVGLNQITSQLGNLFYNELGGTAGSAIPANANFINEQNNDYWSATEDASYSGGAWLFDAFFGNQYGFGKNVQLYVWAVSPGNVSAVPVPGAVWLFGTGLVGLLGLRRRGNIG